MWNANDAVSENVSYITECYGEMNISDGLVA